MIGRRALLQGAAMAGIGGLPSRRPDQAYNPGSPAISPGPQGGVFRGRLVIVYGPSGSVVGLFVYAAGTTPALGNPPIASVTNSSVDPYGNVIPVNARGGTASYNPSQAGIPRVILNNGQVLFEQNSSFQAGSIVDGGIGTMALTSSMNASSLDTAATIILQSTNESDDGAAPEFVIGCRTQAQGVIRAMDPNLPNADENWHVVSPLRSGWSNIVGSTPVRYQKMPHANKVTIQGTVTGGIAGTIFTFAAGSGYVPLRQQDFPVYISGAAPVAGTGVIVRQSGNVDMGTVPAGTSGIAFGFDYSLD